MDESPETRIEVVMLLAVLTALASAACFAAGSALQHRVVGNAPDYRASRLTFVARVVQRPSWLIGMMLSAVAFSLHALALSLGDLTLVQPVIVSGVVFAVIIRAALDRRLPPRPTLIWLLVTWVGLVTFLLSRPDASTGRPDPNHADVVVIAGVLAAVACIVASRRVARDRIRGLLLGAAAGLLFGLVAGLVKLVIVESGGNWLRIFVLWPLWALIAVGIAAVVVNQHAYQAARLSVTAPMLNIVQVVVAIVFGITVLGEAPGSSVPSVLGQTVGLVLVVLGIWHLVATAEPIDQPAPADRSVAERAS